MILLTDDFSFINGGRFVATWTNSDEVRAMLALDSWFISLDEDDTSLDSQRGLSHILELPPIPRENNITRRDMLTLNEALATMDIVLTRILICPALHPQNGYTGQAWKFIVFEEVKDSPPLSHEAQTV